MQNPDNQPILNNTSSLPQQYTERKIGNQARGSRMRNILLIILTSFLLVSPTQAQQTFFSKKPELKGGSMSHLLKKNLSWPDQLTGNHRYQMGIMITAKGEVEFPLEWVGTQPPAKMVEKIREILKPAKFKPASLNQSAIPGYMLVEITLIDPEAPENRAITRPSTSRINPDGSITIKGKIIDQTGEPLIGAKVVVDENGRFSSGSITDEYGTFSFKYKDPNRKPFILKIKYVGYKERAFELDYQNHNLPDSGPIRGVAVSTTQIEMIKVLIRKPQ